MAGSRKKRLYGNVAVVALRDVSKHLRESNVVIVERNEFGTDVWVPTLNQVYTKENRRLNKLLGLGGENMSRSNMSNKV